MSSLHVSRSHVHYYGYISSLCEASPLLDAVSGGLRVLPGVTADLQKLQKHVGKLTNFDFSVFAVSSGFSNLKLASKWSK